MEIPTCSNIADILFEHADKSDKEGNSSAAKCYRFIGSLAFIHLDPYNEDSPLNPAIILGAKRSLAPDDLDDAALETVKKLIATTKCSSLRARFGDLLWIRKKNHEGAQEAATHYLEEFKQIDSAEKWVVGIDSLARGFALARVVGKKKKIFTDYENFIVGRLHEIESFCDDAFGAHLISLLLYQRAGEPKNLASVAESIGNRLDESGITFLSHDYYDIAVCCQERANDVSEAKRIKRKKGGSLVALAEACTTKPGQGYLSATHHLAVGIECLRQGGGNDVQIRGLHRKLLEWQDKSIGEMKVLSAKTDITEMVASAREHVIGKSLRDAIFAFGVGHLPVDSKALRKRVLDHVDKFPISSLVRASLISSDGRVLANKPSSFPANDENKETAVEAEMFRQASLIDWGLRAQAYIDVCRREIWLEHRPTHNDLAFLVLQNPFIPVGHEMLFLKGIVAGFRGDFDIAAHFLVPQIEQSIRHVLKSAGHLTSKLDSKLIQEQRLLGTLLAMPETMEMFGEDHVFELRGLLCEKFGRDLRNRLAHGFVKFDECWGDDVLNLWWLVIRFLCIPLVQPTSNENEKQAEQANE